MSECTQASFGNAHRTHVTGQPAATLECIQTHSIMNAESMLESDHTQTQCNNALEMHVRFRQESIVACIDISMAGYAQDSAENALRIKARIHSESMAKCTQNICQNAL